MSKVEYLTSAGLTVQAIGETLRLSPSELITDEQRQYVRTHKAELLLELKEIDLTANSVPQSVWLTCWCWITAWSSSKQVAPAWRLSGQQRSYVSAMCC